MRTCFGLLFLMAACSANSTSSTAAPDASDQDAAESGNPHTFVDLRDNRSYPTVVIGSQTWLAENMHYETQMNSVCYDDDPANCDTYGRLYTFPAAMEACPAGWHLPSDDEWKTLETTLGMAANQLDVEGYSTARGTIEGAALKVGGSSGFEGQLAGYASGALFDALDAKGYFWTSTESSAQVLRRRLDASTSMLYRFRDVTESYADSVRCLMD